MKPTPKTIQIFLPGGDPQGIRIAEITTRIVQVIEVPRSLLSEFTKMPECGQVALYLLFGDSLEGEKTVYIGQTGDLKSRLNTHNKLKDFWDTALIVISSTNMMTQTHAVFLEWLCLKTSREVNRYPDDNNTAGSEPYTPAPMQADCMEIFETANTLLSTLGYPIFEPIAKPSSNKEGLNTLFCTRPGVNGSGQYTSEGFVVFKGSTGNIEVVSSMLGSPMERKRDELLKNGAYRIVGEKIVMEKDYLFSSPSMAGAFLTGKASNGWIDWRDENGRTLDELERQEPANDEA